MKTNQMTPKTKKYPTVVISRLLLLALLLMSSKCGKENPEPVDEFGLPVPTQTGEDMFACLIDGTKYFAYGGGTCQTIEDAIYLSNEKTFSLTVCNTHDYNCSTTFGLDVLGVSQEGEFVPDTTGNTRIYGCLFEETSLNLYYPINSPQNSVEITRFDLDEGIVSGLFNIDFLNSETGDTIHVTEGRFDVDGLYTL